MRKREASQPVALDGNTVDTDEEDDEDPDEFVYDIQVFSSIIWCA